MHETASSAVRVRFAPSPTGHLHVGNARTALYNWLFARRHGGVNLLRIEDTDVERSQPRFESQLLEDLRWLGLDYDEGPLQGGDYGPYRQSDRMQIYHDYGERLLREQKAYLCFCSAEELEAERKEALAARRSPMYSGRCRALPPATAQQRREQGEACAIRLRIPDHPIRFRDIVHGEIEFAQDALSDPIIIRSSGMPVYNYVVVIDDAEMRITHVIRGDDHLSNTPKQVALYEALGWKAPEFAHLSTILGADRERLSKRHGATSIANFRDLGVLPEALVNYLALLGWAPTGGDREIFSSEELIREFALERVTSSPAVFDMEKLYWLNRHYIKVADPERMQRLARRLFRRKRDCFRTNYSARESAWFSQVVALFAPAVDVLSQLPLRARLPVPLRRCTGDRGTLQRGGPGGPFCSLRALVVYRPAGRPRECAYRVRLQGASQRVKVETGVKGKELFHPIRVMLTGSHAGPEFEKLIPLIEEGSRLPLPVHLPSVRERALAFTAAWQHR